MPIVRKAKAVWKDGLKQGSGEFSFGGFKGRFSFSSRFEDGEGSNPEELLAGAYASCYSMALSAGLERAGFKSEFVETEAEVFMEKLNEGFTITRIVLNVSVKVDGIDDEQLEELARETKKNCPIGKALASVPTIEVKLRRL